uniref:Uncharacterized protein n=1 Tax=Arundo donax TaxID=35708 RepID=A0A0A8XPI8_ARUDO
MDVHLLQHDRPSTRVAWCSPGSADTLMLTHVSKPISNIDWFSTSMYCVTAESANNEAQRAGRGLVLDHFFFFQDHPTGALQWLMENFHMLFHFPLLESSPTLVAVDMISCLFLPKNNSTTIMCAGNIVPQAVCLMKWSSSA